MKKDLTVQEIQSKIINLPGRPPAMLDKDLAQIYDVETGHLNRAANRNPERFPDDFRFRLTNDEINCLKLQDNTIVSSMIRTKPWAYTMEGARILLSCMRRRKATRIAHIMGFDYMIISKIEHSTMTTIINCFKKIYRCLTQYPVGKYRTDLYIPAISVVVECDENGHADRDADYEREKENFIRRKLDCKFVRYNPHEKDFEIGKVINSILLIAIRDTDSDSKVRIIPRHGNDKEADNMIRFVSAWWDKYGDNAVDSAHLLWIASDAELPNLDKGNDKSRKIRLGKMLSNLNGDQVGDYIITDAGKHRNIRLWKLKPAEKSVIDS